VAGDAIEVVLVALIATPKAAIEPETGLDRSGTYEMVALLGKGLLGLDAVHTARMWSSLQYIPMPKRIPGRKKKPLPMKPI
jgi:hypothetical protein